MEKLKQDFLS